MDSGSSDTLAVIALVVSGLSALTAIFSVVLTARWRRQDREAVDHRDWRQRQDAKEREREDRIAQLPDLVVTWQSDTPGEAPGELAVYLGVENVGPTIARDVVVGLRQGLEILRGESADPSLADAQVIPALAPSEQYSTSIVVTIPSSVTQVLRANETRIRDALELWSAYTDKWGERHGENL